MYVALGATGQVGGAVARHLLEQKLSLRVVVRSAEKGEPFAAKACEVAVANVLDTAALTLAFRGAEGVFVLIPPLFDPSEGFPEARAIYASITTALKAARPGRVVCLSTVGAQASEPNLLNQLGMMEQEFGKLDIPVAFLRASWFMENFVWDVASARDEGIVHSFLQPLDRKIPMVATDDIGRAVSCRRTGTAGASSSCRGRHRSAPMTSPMRSQEFSTARSRPTSFRMRAGRRCFCLPA